MPKLLARDIMTREVITLRPGDSVTDAAKALADNRIGGAPVVDANGDLVGIITEGDLIIQDVKLHFPTFIHFLDSYIFLESMKHFEQMLRKAVGVRVSDLMTKEVITATPDESVEDIATLMADEDVSRLPVVEDGKVMGMITKSDIVRSLSRG